jgi:hypothetical protein
MVLVIKFIIMKAIKFIVNPYTVIVSFLVIIISGEHLGGLYALYILLGLIHGAIHSVVGLLGILLLIITQKKYKDVKAYSIRYAANLVGALLLILSLFLFFYRDKTNYNIGTFQQTVPQVMLAVFSVILLSFILANLSAVFKIPRRINMY